jgi:hypothetical protein
MCNAFVAVQRQHTQYHIYSPSATVASDSTGATQILQTATASCIHDTTPKYDDTALAVTSFPRPSELLNRGNWSQCDLAFTAADACLARLTLRGHAPTSIPSFRATLLGHPFMLVVLNHFTDTLLRMQVLTGAV